VAPFKEVTSCRVRFLSVEEQRALVAACSESFKELVIAALFTGCRFGELARLKVRDFDPISATLLIEISKSGKPRRVSMRPEAKAWFQALVEGRGGDQPMLIKIRAGANGPRGPKEDLGWQAHDQKKLMGEACRLAGVERLTFHELRHTYASTLIRARVPLYVVAKQLGHGDTRMVERYYGHLAPSDLAAVIEELAPDLHLAGEGKVQPLAIPASA
jgi:integrase